MATAIEVLKAATSQLQLSSPLGRWAQKVSQLLSSSGVFAPDFMFVKRVGDQGQIGVGDAIHFNAVVDSQGGLTVDGGTGVITLNANKTYLLRSEGALSSFSDSAAGELDFQWTDASGVTLQGATGDSPKSMMVPTTHTGGGGGSPLAGNSVIEMVYRTGSTLASRQVKVTDASGTGTANPLGGKWWAMVQEIPRD